MPMANPSYNDNSVTEDKGRFSQVIEENREAEFTMLVWFTCLFSFNKSLLIEIFQRAPVLVEDLVLSHFDQPNHVNS